MNRKADYVRNAPHPLGHTCHWTGCTVSVPPAMWGCKKHWFRLPPQIRRKIWAAYQPGQEITKDPSRAYIEAAREAEAWIAEHGDKPQAKGKLL